MYDDDDNVLFGFFGFSRLPKEEQNELWVLWDLGLWGTIKIKWNCTDLDFLIEREAE